MVLSLSTNLPQSIDNSGLYTLSLVLRSLETHKDADCDTKREIHTAVKS